MKRKPSLVVAALAVFALCSGCFVKEDREDCPCLYVLELGQIDTLESGEVEVEINSQDGFLYSKNISSSDFKTPLSVEVPRKGINVCVVSCDRGLFRSGEGLLIPPGEDCPPVYMYSNRLDTRADIVRDTALLHKNYCRMTLQLVSDRTITEFEMNILGNVCGYDNAGKPLQGRFNSMGEQLDATKALVNLPRQKDSSLRLQVYEAGEVVREFALGEYIAASGYDWEAPDLGNLNVTVNFSLAKIGIEVEPWSPSFEYEVEI